MYGLLYIIAGLKHSINAKISCLSRIDDGIKYIIKFLYIKTEFTIFSCVIF